MDNHFVPNLTIGPMVVKALRKHTQEAVRRASDGDAGRSAGAGLRRCRRRHDLVPSRSRTASSIAPSSSSSITASGRAACSIRRRRLPPIENVLGDLDLVLVMSVNPGFGGQAFIESQLAKIAALRKAIDALGKPIDLEVDGGVNPETAQAVPRRPAPMRWSPAPRCSRAGRRSTPPTSRRCADDAAAGARVARIAGWPRHAEDKARVQAWDRLFAMLNALDSKTSALLRFNAIVVAALAYLVVVARRRSVRAVEADHQDAGLRGRPCQPVC